MGNGLVTLTRCNEIVSTRRWAQQSASARAARRNVHVYVKSGRCGFTWWRNSWLWEHFPPAAFCTALGLQWRHNERNCVSNHQPRDCLLKRLFSGRSKKTPKLLVTGLWEFTGDREFPAQRARNAENVSIWWRHHGEPAPCSFNIYSVVGTISWIHQIVTLRVRTCWLEIFQNSNTLYLIFLQLCQIKMLQISRQQYCRDMCKISLWCRG